MQTKIAYLRQQVAAYWQDAKAQQDDAEAQRLILLAIRCQEMLLELEHGITLSRAPKSA